MQLNSPDSVSETIARNTAPIQKVDQRVDHHDHGSKTLGIIALILSGAALGGIIVLAILMHIYWAESRLANLHYADMKAAMLAHGINPNPHMPSESP